MGFRVVVTDHVFEDLQVERAILKEIDAEVYEFQCNTQQEVLDAAADADVIFTTNFRTFTRELISKLKRCKAIVRYGIGVDTIDISAATEFGIFVVNIPDYCIDEVSDHAVALTLAQARKLFASNRQVKSLEYNVAGLKPIKSLRDSTIGIIGFGRIGKLTAKKLSVFGPKIVFYNPRVKDDFREDGVMCENVSLEMLLKISDYIIIQAPLTNENYHMINRDILGKMQKKPYIINVGRGEIIDSEALAEAVEMGLVSGAALDVTEGMPPVPADNPLLKYDNVIFTPHSAWYSERSLFLLKKTAAEEAVRVLRGQKPYSLVNKEVIAKLDR